MSYKLTEFDGVSLPSYNRESGLDTAPPLDGFVATVMGGYDSYQTDIAPMATPYPLSVRGIVSAETDADQRAAIDGLRALGRRRGQLIRVAEDDDSEQFCYARLQQIAHRRIAGINGYQVLELVFLIESGWYEERPSQQEVMSSSPHTLSVENAGNRMVADAVLTVSADDANLTAVTLTTTNGTHLVWTGTVLAGDDLVIDCGAKSVTNDGANAYSGLSYGANHSIDDWLRVEGEMDITIAYTGGGTSPTVTIAYNDGWA
ncbi:MAG TPA: hypothetical protein PKA43_00215 [Candidatus Competibacter phosphatis]|nr:hypothetical protein [Candidatus Competibacter phosphatis]